MSIESAKAFLERLENDEDFRKNVGQIATAEERIEYVKTAGFDFTKEELDDVTEQLSDIELDKIAGGVVDDCGVSATINFYLFEAADNPGFCLQEAMNQLHRGGVAA